MITPAQAQEIVEEFGTPTYVYDIDDIVTQFKKLKAGLPDGIKICYAGKANTNKDVLKALAEAGCGYEGVSPGSVTKALQAGIPAEKIIVTCNAMTEEEMKFYLENNIQVNCDSLSQVKLAAQLGAKKIGIRLNLGVGAGEFDNLITGGALSKFGAPEPIEEILEVAQEAGITINGIHQHIGSSILTPETIIAGNRRLLRAAKQFPDLEYIDIGGGYGIPYKGEDPFPVEEYGSMLRGLFEQFTKEYGKEIALYTEPGRFLVARQGLLLAKIQDIKNVEGRIVVGINTGMQHLLRPALYGATHTVRNLSQNGEEQKHTFIVGNVCESSDLFAEDISFPRSEVGDIVALENAGAYGYTMASHYNSRELPAEVVINNGAISLSTARKEAWKRV